MSSKSDPLRTGTDGEWRIQPGEEKRLDQFLASQHPEHSRTYFQRLIDKRLVLLDGHPASSSHRLRAGQHVTLRWPPKAVKPPRSAAEPLPFPVLFEDEAMIVIDKPVGLVAHPSAGHHHGKTLVELLAPHLSQGPWPDEARPGLVHRLDRDTSGVIVLAKTPQSHHHLSRQFERRQVHKTYNALAKGAVEAAEGTLECRIGRDPGQRQRFAVSAQGRWASTKFRVKERLGDLATLLELYPLTGRTHQLRVQLASFGHPILGDRVYGGFVDPDLPKFPRQMLHAARLELKHPVTGKDHVFEAPLPSDFEESIKVLRSWPR